MFFTLLCPRLSGKCECVHGDFQIKNYMVIIYLLYKKFCLTCCPSTIIYNQQLVNSILYVLFCILFILKKTNDMKEVTNKQIKVNTQSSWNFTKELLQSINKKLYKMKPITSLLEIQ